MPSPSASAESLFVERLEIRGQPRAVLPASRPTRRQLRHAPELGLARARVVQRLRRTRVALVGAGATGPELPTIVAASGV